MKNQAFLLLSFLILLGACKADPTPTPQSNPVQARADVYSLNPESGVPLKVGEALLSYEQDVVSFTFTVSGMPPGGEHAVHLHEGSCENPGGHWNGGGSENYCTIPSQGLPWGKPYLGDIGNLLVGEDGSGTLSLKTELWTLGDGSPRDVAGTFVMLHEGPEDYAMACDPEHSGHMPANAKIACGEIVVME